ncbi:WG repeat-containing protein [Mucisphaera sp.]|uniref:WG repeat-containing protein n=1 Tax=Mucisphaera sp. TaxID=2913024 RepID=UPI003D135047
MPANAHQPSRLTHRQASLLLAVTLTLIATTSAITPPAEPWTPRWLANAQDTDLTYTGPQRDKPVYPIIAFNRAGYATSLGEIAIPPAFDWADNFYEGLARVGINGKTAYLNRAAEIQIEPLFDAADRFANGRARVAVNGKWGFIDKNGRWILQPELDAAGRFSENAATILVNDRVGYIDRSGRVLIPPSYLKARAFADNKAAVLLPGPNPDNPKDNARWAVIDRSGRTLWIDRDHTILELGDFSDNLLRARTQEGWGYLNPSFRWAITPRFQNAGDFSANLAPAQQNNLWGYINQQADWRIQPAYQLAHDFEPETNTAMVDTRGAVGFIDRSGRWIIPPQLIDAEPFETSWARVRLPSGWTWIDRQGRSFWDPARRIDNLIDRSARVRAITRTNTDLIFDIRTRYPNNNDDPTTDTTTPDNRSFPPEYLYDPILPEPDNGLTRTTSSQAASPTTEAE